MPYWPLWLKANGFDDALLGQVLAFGFVAKVAVNPLFRSVANRFGTHITLSITLVIVCAIFQLFNLTLTLSTLVLVQLAFLAFWVPVLPTTEHIALSQARKGYVDYGRVRVWGSIGFMLTTIVVGRVVENGPIDRVQSILAGLLLAVFCMTLILPGRRQETESRRGFRLRVLLKVPNLPLVLLAAGLIQSSHVMFYGFGSIYWTSIGIGESTIGLLWAEGIIVEIGVFIFAAGLSRKLNPLQIMSIGGAAAAIRWTFMPMVTTMPLVFLIQALHGASFGMTHLGAMRFLSTSVDESLSADAVALYSMMVMGLSMGIVAFFSGRVYALYHGESFWAMTTIALAGAAIMMFMARTSARFNQ